MMSWIYDCVHDVKDYFRLVKSVQPLNTVLNKKKNISQCDDDVRRL